MSKVETKKKRYRTVDKTKTVDNSGGVKSSSSMRSSAGYSCYIKIGLQEKIRNERLKCGGKVLQKV